MQADITANQHLIAKFQAEIAEYQAEVASQIQEYTTNIQKDTMDYGWYQSQYTMLSSDYIKGVTMLKTGNLPTAGGQS